MAVGGVPCGRTYGRSSMWERSWLGVVPRGRDPMGGVLYGRTSNGTKCHVFTDLSLVLK